MKNEIVSVYTVIDYKKGKREEVTLTGSGQAPINLLRKNYPRFSKFVLEGFEINGNFISLDLSSNNRL